VNNTHTIGQAAANVLAWTDTKRIRREMIARFSASPSMFNSRLGVPYGGYFFSTIDAVWQIRALLAAELENKDYRGRLISPDRVVGLRDRLAVARYFRRFGMTIWQRAYREMRAAENRDAAMRLMYSHRKGS
jgi:hypothetical protein